MRLTKSVRCLAGLLAALPLLAACHLLDQRDFDPKAGRPPALPKPPPAPVGPGALLTISYADGEPAYAAALSQAVKRALSIKSDVVFTVQTEIPLAGNAADQAQALTEAAATGREIAEAIITDGADQGQIELTVGTDPNLKAKEIHLFVH
jgi:hypothetical protein